MVGLTSKATSWGTGIEQLSIGFVTYTLRPWLTRWTQAIRRDLILAPNTYFADFVIESLLRGDVSSRYNAYAIARQWGWLSVNDIRQLENMNPVDDGDIYLTPMNMSPAGQSRQAMADNPHYRLLAEEAAGRLVRKEVMAMGKASERAGANREAWGQAVLDFYTDHAGLVAQTMRVSLDLAESYCRENQRELLTEGYRATADWHTRRVSRLADMVVNDD